MRSCLVPIQPVFMQRPQNPNEWVYKSVVYNNKKPMLLITTQTFVGQIEKY